MIDWWAAERRLVGRVVGGPMDLSWMQSTFLKQNREWKDRPASHVDRANLRMNCRTCDAIPRMIRAIVSG